MTTTDPHAAINATETALIKGGMDLDQVRRVTDVLRAVADGTDATIPLQAMSVPVQRTGPSPMVALCSSCAWKGNRFTASLHERDIPGHRVTVWVHIGSDIVPGEMYPRSMWAGPVTFPQAS